MKKYEAVRIWEAEMLPSIKADEGDNPDWPARRMSWNDFVAGLQKGGDITKYQGGTWLQPASALRVNKYEYLHVLQGHYDTHGWEDLMASTVLTEVRADLRSYRDNERGTYRIIQRREKNG